MVESCCFYFEFKFQKNNIWKKHPILFGSLHKPKQNKAKKYFSLFLVVCWILIGPKNSRKTFSLKFRKG
jgi:hypothetical protein